MKATGGRDASRERRAMLARGKAGLPPAAERTRTGLRSAATVPPSATAATSILLSAGREVAVAPPASGRELTGRAASRARRQSLVQGKTGVPQFTALRAAPPAGGETGQAANTAPDAGVGRSVAQAMRAARASNGRGEAAATRPSGRVRTAQPIQYPPKVADTETYAGGKVTGIRIGRGANVTGDEPGADVQVTGTQYIGRETGFNPREGGVKVGAARTAGGLVVTGSQVRSRVSITGDESNPAIRITGEADQELADDLLERREAGAYSAMQFQRQHNPHGHTVFGANLGRSIKTVGSRERDREHALEKTGGGLPVTGTAVGRSPRVTGDEPGSCRSITGDQYLMPADEQPLCEAPGGKTRARAGSAMARLGNNGGRLDPVTGDKVTVSESWTRQRVTGVDVEHNANVSGDEYGACTPVTGTPYVGPAQYETVCASEEASETARRVTPGAGPGNRVSGDAPVNVERVTGTQRGAGRGITGTPYYRADVEQEMKGDAIGRIEQIGGRFSVRSPQREAQLRAGAVAVQAPTAVGRITGAFAVGEGKITGNQEFHFSPRARDERAARTRVTGEGRVQGPPITGSAWVENPKVTGTEDYIAAERNPSERAGKRHAFAGAGLFKGKGVHEEPRQIVTGMVGWSPKSAAKVTLSGGAQG
jgi:hypothetical protein